MYILFKKVDEKTQRNIIHYGEWTLWTIGYIPETHVDILEYQHLNPTVLDDNVAKAWKFIGEYRDFITVKDNTVQMEQLDLMASEEEMVYKQKYYLSDTEKQNTVKLMKAIMRKWLDEVYDKRQQGLNLTTSDLEASSWAQQRAEAESFNPESPNAPMLQLLATARGITLQEMVNKVNSAVDEYNLKVATLLSQKQAVEQEIKSCQTIPDCNRLLHNRYDLQMPVQQMFDEFGTNQNSSLNL